VTQVEPNLQRWQRQGHVDREAWLKAGAAGLLCMTLPKAYGGAGRDFRYDAILREEFARVDVSGTALGMGLHSDVVVPMLWRHGTQEQRARWLAPMIRA
jgi:acyl-CoA dehydrogenase